MIEPTGAFHGHEPRIETEERLENIRAWAHTVNAAEVPDGRLLLVWSAGQFEDSEDMVVMSCALKIRPIDAFVGARLAREGH